jgi:hypothetical protein
MTFLLACQSIWEQVLGVSLALLPSASLYRDEANVNVQQGKPIPKDEAEWIGAGFRSGWMKFDDKGIAHFEANQIAGGIRAFRYSRDYEGLNFTTALSEMLLVHATSPTTRRHSCSIFRDAGPAAAAV